MKEIHRSGPAKPSELRPCCIKVVCYSYAFQSWLRQCVPTESEVRFCRLLYGSRGSTPCLMIGGIATQTVRLSFPLVFASGPSVHTANFLLPSFLFALFDFTLTLLVLLFHASFILWISAFSLASLLLTCHLVDSTVWPWTIPDRIHTIIVLGRL